MAAQRGRDHSVALPQYFLNLAIGDFPEIPVPLPYGVERFGHCETNALVRLFSQAPAGFRRSDGNGDYQRLRVQTADIPGGHRHCRSGRQTVIDKDYSPAAEIVRWKTTPVKSFTTLYLVSLACNDGFHRFFRDAKVADDLIVQDLGATNNRAHCELRLPGDTKFANHDYIRFVRVLDRIGCYPLVNKRGREFSFVCPVRSRERTFAECSIRFGTINGR
jgi:hypothetical protein